MIVELTVVGKPIAKKRPRFFRGKTIDVQGKEKRDAKIQMMQQMGQIRNLRRLESTIAVHMRFYTPVPQSWSQKRKEREIGTLDTRCPDLDNYVKFYLDVMNNLIYSDDSAIVQIWCEKRISDTPRTEIIVYEIGDNPMVNEHIITITGEISLDDLNYMTRKAHRLGMLNRNFVRVYMQEDDEGKHFYFECESPGCGAAKRSASKMRSE